LVNVLDIEKQKKNFRIISLRKIEMQKVINLCSN